MLAAMSKRRQFPRFTPSPPSCPVHQIQMQLVQMPRPMFTLLAVGDQRSRLIWKCSQPGCARVEFSPERDWCLAPAPAPIDAQARKAFRDRRATIKFGNDE
jgi:hypothetical protein